ncbi:MAG: hypothetical protein NVSMB47_10520 [Polyangiales bacterium]
MKLPRRLPASPARTVAATVVASLLFAIGFVPLFDGPGYEHALASGLIVPITAAIVAALESFTGPHDVDARSPLQLVVRGVETGALLASVALLVSFLHVLRVGACDPLGGIATFALTALAGSLLGGASGAVAALLVAHALPAHRRRRRLAIALAALAPIATASAALVLFYSTPAVFAFDPYAGFFSGTLYDVVVDAYRPLLTYRAGTALTLSAILVGAMALSRDATGRLSLERAPLLATAVGLGCGSLVLIGFGEQLGHRTSAGHVQRTLGGHRRGPRCEAWYPLDTAPADAALLLRDCEEEIAAVEQRLGAHGPPTITAYFFRDAAQKRALMGAADTYVAKPWRREVYLQVATYPHPVLGHELAHVVAGSFGQGPFEIAGRLGGLLPNPGLIEGLAVAASPDKDELTPAQWAHAMKQLDLLPPLSRLFGGGFFATNSSTAYTVAGAFVGWLIDRGDPAPVRAWYGGASFDQAFGASFVETEGRWLASLDQVALPPEALAVAKARFDRPGIWGRRCPHVVERLREEADECRERGDLDAAESKLRALLRLDVADPSARVDLAHLAGDRDDDAGFAAQLRALIDDPRLSTTWRNRARETLGDEELRAGDLDEAHLAYQRAREEVLDEDWARTLDVKAYLTAEPRRAAIFARMFVRRDRHRDEATPALVGLSMLVARADAPPTDVALARYLLARRLVDAKALADAGDMLGGVEALAAISPRLPREAARLRLTLACLTPRDGRETRVHEALDAYRAQPAANDGRRGGVERMAARCVSTPM